MAASQNFPASQVAENAQLTDATGTAVSSSLVAGSSTGRRIREITVYSGATIGPAPGTVLMLLLQAGTSINPTPTPLIVGSAICPGGVNTLQASFLFAGLPLPTIYYNLRAQLRTPLASGATLDFLFVGEDF